MLPIQFSVNVPGKVAEGRPTANPKEDHNGVPGSWLPHGPALAVAAIWKVNQYMEDLSLLLLFKQIKLKKLYWLLPNQ